MAAAGTQIIPHYSCTVVGKAAVTRRPAGNTTDSPTRGASLVHPAKRDPTERQAVQTQLLPISRTRLFSPFSLSLSLLLLRTFVREQTSSKLCRTQKTSLFSSPFRFTVVVVDDVVVFFLGGWVGFFFFFFLSVFSLPTVRLHSGTAVLYDLPLSTGTAWQYVLPIEKVPGRLLVGPQAMSSYSKPFLQLARDRRAIYKGGWADSVA